MFGYDGVAVCLRSDRLKTPIHKKRRLRPKKMVVGGNPSRDAKHWVEVGLAGASSHGRNKTGTAVPIEPLCPSRKCI